MKQIIKNFLDNFNTAYNNLYEYLHSLSLEQLLAVNTISGSIFILFCISTIITTIYGDRLIIYFNLETIFPKLANLIKLRRKFLDYYLIFNLFLMVLVLVYMIYLNSLMLFY